MLNLSKQSPRPTQFQGKGKRLYSLTGHCQGSGKAYGIKNIAKMQSATHMKRQDFPGGAVVENLPANAGDTDLIWEYST